MSGIIQVSNRDRGYARLGPERGHGCGAALDLLQQLGVGQAQVREHERGRPRVLLGAAPQEVGQRQLTVVETRRDAGVVVRVPGPRFHRAGA